MFQCPTLIASESLLGMNLGVRSCGCMNNMLLLIMLIIPKLRAVTNDNNYYKYSILDDDKCNISGQRFDVVTNACRSHQCPSSSKFQTLSQVLNFDASNINIIIGLGSKGT